MFKQEEIVLERFSEADAGIEADRLVRNSALGERAELAGEKFAHFGDDIFVMRRELHRLRRALRVHGDNAAARLRADFLHFRVQKSRDVVDDFRAGGEGELGDARFAGVDGKGDVELGVAEDFDGGDDAREFLVGADFGGAGAGGFATDVEQIRAVRNHFSRASEESLGAWVRAAVGERVGGDVENAHDERTCFEVVEATA